MPTVPPAPNPSPEAGATPDSPRFTILLIEDNPGDARLIQVMLAEAGENLFTLERVDRLSRGLERLERGDVGLVLLDLSLPDSHGLQTFHRLHDAAPQVPIIVLSGLNDETVAVNSVHEGAQDYLVKGHVDSVLLVRSIRYALERKRITEELERVATQLREKNAQMEADLSMAREIQQVFLPHQYPAFPRHVSPEQSALRFYHRYLPAAAVSGDFFTVLPISDVLAGVFICDVMGHGLRAALVTAIMRGLVEELMPIATEPGRFLTEINRSLLAILQRTDEPLLATACYMVTDLAKGELQFSIAGHPSPVRLMPSQGLAEPLRNYDPRHGPAMGLFEKSTYPTCSCPLAERDVILSYTDGLYEVEGSDHQEYGHARLLTSLRERVQLPPPQLFDALIVETQEFSQDKEFDDDVCLLAMEVRRLGDIGGGSPAL